MANRTRIGIVGCGKIAGAHLTAYQATDAEIVSVYDPCPEAADAMAERTDARVASSLSEMIERDRVDAVSVCSPPAVHLENCQPFLDAGVAVLCEKPLEVNGNAARTLADLADASASLFMTAFCHRFHPGIIELKRLVDAGTLGEPILFRNIFGGYADMSGNHRADPALSGGGCLIDHCAHSVDLFRFLVGDPTHAQALAGNVMQDLPIEDFGMIHLSCGDRMFGEITASYSLPVCGNWVEWYGTRGAAMVSYWNAGHPDLVYRTVDSPEWQTVDCSARPDRFAGEVRHFLDSIAAAETPSVTAADGLRANLIADAIYESVRTGRRSDVAV